MMFQPKKNSTDTPPDSEPPAYPTDGPSTPTGASSDRWTEAMKNLKTRMSQYKAIAEGDAEGVDQAVENVAAAFEDIANCTDDPEVREEYRKKASDFRTNPAGRDGALKSAAKGFLMILAAPVALAGAGLYAAGSILEGVSMILKAAGKGGKKAIDGVSGL